MPGRGLRGKMAMVREILDGNGKIQMNEDYKDRVQSISTMVSTEGKTIGVHIVTDGHGEILHHCTFDHESINCPDEWWPL